MRYIRQTVVTVTLISKEFTSSLGHYINPVAALLYKTLPKGCVIVFFFGDFNKTDDDKSCHGAYEGRFMKIRQMVKILLY